MILRNEAPEQRGNSRQLVVGMHAFTSSSRRLSDVRAAVAEALPDADLLFPDYHSNVFSRTRAVRIALELVDAIRTAVQAREARGGSYDEIILLGHSLGALVVRKAYAFARGLAEDSGQGLTPVEEAWAPLVKRIILFAGMNRGWSFHPRPRHMRISRWATMAVGSLLWRWLRLGTLINDVRRGAPFLVNLRIQWINLVGRLQGAMPVTIQLLGDIDDIVTVDDNVDVQSGADFVYRKVPDTGHANVISFSGAAGGVRRRIFVEALTTPVPELKSDFVPPLQRDFDVDRIVFVMHGIRDFGFWTGKVGEVVKERALARGAKVAIGTPGYGYFPMLGFLIQPERQEKVREFMDSYTEMLAKYPRARVSFIGHSNGTYLLGSALQRYEACRFDRVVLAGSVLPGTFPWGQYIAAKRVQAVQNYVATADWVVGVFPHFLGFFPHSDLGGAGHTGFTSSETHPHQVVYIQGQHSAAIVEANFSALADFALGDDAAMSPPQLLKPSQSTAVIIASRLCWLIWLIIVAVAVLPIALPLMQAANGSWRPDAIPWWLPVALWPPFLIAVLRTI